MPRRLFFWAAILGLFLDQVTKVAVYGLVETGGPVRLVGDFLRVWRTGNEHGIFGISFGHRFIHIGLQAAGAVLVTVLGLKNRDRFSAVAYGMILGGAIGNLIDRVRIGHVIDFIDIGLRGWRWYTFNLADTFVICGIILLLAREFIFRRKPAAAASAATRTEDHQA
jgi:signal peptidase II